MDKQTTTILIVAAGIGAAYLIARDKEPRSGGFRDGSNPFDAGRQGRQQVPAGSGSGPPPQQGQSHGDRALAAFGMIMNAGAALGSSYIQARGA